MSEPTLWRQCPECKKGPVEEIDPLAPPLPEGFSYAIRQTYGFCQRCRNAGVVPVASSALLIEEANAFKAVIEDEVEAVLRCHPAPGVGWGYWAGLIADAVVRRLRAACGEGT